MTSAAKESQLIALAYDLVEHRLRNGTATSQETVHFLKMGSAMAKLEKRELEEKIKYLEAKSEAMESAKRIESLYKEAIDSVMTYRSPVVIGGPDRHDD